MTFNIIKKNENKYLLRTEYLVEIGFKGAVPSNEEVKKTTAKGVNVDGSLVVVKQILVKQGKEIADCNVYVYTSKEALEKIEPKKKEKKAAAKPQQGAEEGEPAK